MNDIEYVHDVLDDDRTAKQAALFIGAVESALKSKYPRYKSLVTERAIRELDDLSCDLFMDDNSRVTRDIKRKLDPDERLFGTATLLLQYNKSCDVMKKALQFGLKDYNKKKIIDIWNQSKVPYGKIEMNVLDIIFGNK